MEDSSDYLPANSDGNQLSREIIYNVTVSVFYVTS